MVDLLTSEMIRSIHVLSFVFAIAINANAENYKSPQSIQNCGVRKSGSGLIVWGQNFSRGTFPWIVPLISLKRELPSYFCGGTIISSTFVLSGE